MRSAIAVTYGARSSTLVRSVPSPALLLSLVSLLARLATLLALQQLDAQRHRETPRWARTGLGSDPTPGSRL
jgi:hypothetical protein